MMTTVPAGQQLGFKTVIGSFGIDYHAHGQCYLADQHRVILVHLEEFLSPGYSSQWGKFTSVQGQIFFWPKTLELLGKTIPNWFYKADKCRILSLFLGGQGQDKFTRSICVLFLSQNHLINTHVVCHACS